jgi:tetratricopeptide (TPR) repeat protein
MFETLLVQAQMAQRTGDEATAEAAARQASRIQPDSEAALLLNAQIIARHTPEAVLPLLAGFVAKYPNAATIRALYAQQLLASGHLPEARAEARRILEQPEVAPEPLFAAAAVAVQAQAPDLAVQLLDRLLTVESIDAALIQYNLGLAYEAQADLEHNQPSEEGARVAAETESIAHYMQVRRGEYFVPARLRAASLMMRQGNVEGARALLHNTPAPDAAAQTELLIGEAALLSDSGDRKAALQVLERAVSKYPDNVTLRYELGMTAERLGRTDLFERSMRAVIKKDPKYAQAYNALGFTYADRNERLKESRTLIDKALSLAPNDPFILDSMGWLCYREKKLDAALDYLNRAATLRSDPEIIAHQVAVLQAMGRQVDALAVWRAGIQRFPESAELKAAGKNLPSPTDPSASQTP